MTRKSQRSKPAGPAKVIQDSLSDGASNEPISLGTYDDTNHSTTSSVVNGAVSSGKSSRMDIKDVPLKDRLRKQRVDESRKNADPPEKCSCTGRLDGNVIDGSLAGQSTTPEETLNKPIPSSKNASEVNSMAVLLGQGLTSGENEKIDAVLSNGDIQVISATLNDLPITQIVPLLKQIEYRLRNRNVQDIRVWVRWIQYIISIHMAYLSSMETLEDDLKGLFDWMRSRTSQMGKLCSLYGKISLVTEQIERRSNPRLFIPQEPMAFFAGDDLSSSDESEEQDDLEDESIESNDDWWDDEELASNSDQDGPESEEDDNEKRKKRKYPGDEELEDADEQEDEGSSDLETE